MRYLVAVKNGLRKQAFLLFGLALGLFFTLSLDASPECQLAQLGQRFLGNHSTVVPRILNGSAPVAAAGRGVKKVHRPTYYETELGIRRKLFVGVFSSVEHLGSRGVLVNGSSGHLVDELRFFVGAKPKTGAAPLKNVVAFTDQRDRYRYLNVLKYLADTFEQEYDYFFLMEDVAYLDARRLRFVANKISVSQDVYLGTRKEGATYCKLEGGVLISNSVLVNVKKNLDWCRKNSISVEASENLGRCISRSTGLDCQEQVQEQSIPSYRMVHFNVKQHLSEIINQNDFMNAIVVHPVLGVEDFNTLHAYYSKRNLQEVLRDIQHLTGSIFHKEVTWPLGQRQKNRPRSRFDVLINVFFNRTHTFFTDDHSNVQLLDLRSRLELEDILRQVLERVDGEQIGRHRLIELVNGYKQFDFARGLLYTLDLRLADGGSEEASVVVRRFEVFKPLGKAEVLPLPFVTENTKVTVLVPVGESDIPNAASFVDMYHQTIPENQGKSLVMMILLYGPKTPSKGNSDYFGELKKKLLSTAGRNHRIAWISIRLPEQVDDHRKIAIGIIDLAVRKVGEEALVLLLDTLSDISLSFMNRVRLNTIIGRQFFSPIPFQLYHPKVAGDTLVPKEVGFFNRDLYNYISFYAKDYLKARKAMQKIIPQIRADKDLHLLLGIQTCDLPDCFLVHLPELHCLRAPDPGLRVRYQPQHGFVAGSKAQLGRIVLSHQAARDL